METLKKLNKALVVILGMLATPAIGVVLGAAWAASKYGGNFGLELVAVIFVTVPTWVAGFSLLRDIFKNG